MSAAVLSLSRPDTHYAHNLQERLSLKDRPQAKGTDACGREAQKRESSAALCLLGRSCDFPPGSLKLHQPGALLSPPPRPHVALCPLTKPQLRKDPCLFRRKLAKEMSQHTALGETRQTTSRGSQLLPRALSLLGQQTFRVLVPSPELTQRVPRAQGVAPKPDRPHMRPAHFSAPQLPCRRSSRPTPLALNPSGCAGHLGSHFLACQAAKGLLVTITPNTANPWGAVLRRFLSN